MFDYHAVFEAIVLVDWTPIVLSIVLGGLIGAEREIHGRPAGFRTHILVCLASTVLIRASLVLPAAIPGTGIDVTTVFDPNRLGAGVVTGIGFLGAAAVIRSGDIVRGITTGACVWAVAVIGVVIGSGGYGLAVAGAVTMLTVLVVFDRALGWATPVVYRRMQIVADRMDLRTLQNDLRPVLEQHGVLIQDSSGQCSEGRSELVLHVRCRNHLQAPDVLEAACELEGVRAAEWSMLSR